MINIKKELKDNKIILLVIPNTAYKEVILNVSTQLSQMGEVCYISLNKTTKYLRGLFQQKKIKSDRFFYIDCITKTMKDPTKERNCIFVSSPNAINELELAIIKAGNQNRDIVLFDSLSTLLMYHRDDVSTQFAHSLINEIREADIYGVLTILEKDKDSSLSKDLGMIVDKVIPVIGFL